MKYHQLKVNKLSLIKVMFQAWPGDKGGFWKGKKGIKTSLKLCLDKLLNISSKRGDLLFRTLHVL